MSSAALNATSARTPCFMATSTTCCNDEDEGVCVISRISCNSLSCSPTLFAGALPSDVSPTSTRDNRARVPTRAASRTFRRTLRVPSVQLAGALQRGGVRRFHVTRCNTNSSPRNANCCVPFAFQLVLFANASST